MVSALALLALLGLLGLLALLAVLLTVQSLVLCLGVRLAVPVLAVSGALVCLQCGSFWTLTSCASRSWGALGQWTV